LIKSIRRAGRDLVRRREIKSIRALWLKRIEPRPAEFLKSRFLFQLEQKP